MKMSAVVVIRPGLEQAEPGAHFPSLRVESLQSEVAWAAEFGFEGLQVGWPGPPPVPVEEMAAVFRGEGVAVAAVSAYTDLLSDEHNWVCADLDEVKETIGLAPVLGAEVAVTWGGFGDSAQAESRRVVYEALAEEAAVAEEHGVRVAIELYDQCVVGTVEEVARAAEIIGTGALGVMMDPPNTMTEADLADLPGYYRRIMTVPGAPIFAAHAKDVLFEDGVRKLPGPGQGQQDYVAYLRALAAAGYDGFLSIEHIKRDEAEAARDFVASKMAQALSDSNR